MIQFVTLLAAAQAINVASTPQFLDNYSAFKLFAGIGPYSSRRSDGVDYELPAGFNLTQAVMWHRHGERYPDSDNSADYEAVLAKISNRTSTPQEFEFLDSWTYYANNDTYGAETTTGPYGGIDQSYKLGVQDKSRYLHLAGGGSLHLWSASSSRVVATAMSWARGFHPNYNLTVIDETDDANSLTPSCKGADSTTCDDTTTLVPEFTTAADRLNAALGISLTADDISNLMEVGLYEINVRGDSPWLDVFSSSEWLAKEYTRSYRVFCKRAHGSPKGMASGSVLTNATLGVLQNSDRALTVAFVHDTQISQMVGAAGLLNSTNNFVANQVTFGNQIEISDVVPMGAHIVFEKISNGTADYVRVVLNEAVVPIGWCSDGPGYSCALDDFAAGLNKLYKSIGWESNCKKSSPNAFTLFD